MRYDNKGTCNRKARLVCVQARLAELLEGNGGSYILPFFWQHGEDEATLRKYMRKIRAANIREVCVESRPHPDFCGPKWWADIDAILNEARQMDMRVWILDDSHFPSGYCNGAYDDCPKELCKQYLKFATAEVYGPMPGVRFDIYDEMREVAKPIKPHVFPGLDIPDEMKKGQPPIRVFDDDALLGVFAYRFDAGGKLIDYTDVSAFVEGGVLTWDVPDGRWRIYAPFTTRNGGGVTSYMNVLDYDSVKLILQNIYEPHFARYAADFGKTLAGFFSDEPLFGNFPWNYTPAALGSSEMALPWSKDIPAELEKRLGANWLRVAAHLWTEGADADVTQAARIAYMDAVTALVKENYSLQIGNWCEAHGVQYIGHIVEDMGSSGGLGASLGHFFRSMAGMHMGGMDVIGGQYIPSGAYRAEADRGNFYHFTLGKLGTSYAHLDPRKGGRSMIELFGAYGWEFGVRDMKRMADHFLTCGVNRFVPHAFSPKAFPDPDCPPHFYAHGENPQFGHFGTLMAYMQRVAHLIDGGRHIAPVALLHADEAVWAGGFAQARNLDRMARLLIENQIDFDFVPADLFSDPAAYVLQDKLKIGGEAFSALVIAQTGYVPDSVRKFAEAAKAQGFPVLYAAEEPALAERLRAVGACDVHLEMAFPDLRYYRYAHTSDLYLFCNEHAGEAYIGRVTVLSRGDVCAYDAWENVLRPIAHRAVEGGTELTITVRPFEPVIVVFDPPEGARIPEGECSGAPVQLDKWTVSVCESKEHPAFRPLAESDEMPDAGILLPDFSGHIRYETRFYADGDTAVLEIADAYEGVSVWLNGAFIGSRVAPRFRFDLSGALCKGENVLTIEVTTNLARKMDKMLGKTFALYKKSPAILPIGIVGEVGVYVK